MSGDNAGIDNAGTTVTVAVLVSFAAFASGFADVTVAVFETGPGVDGSVTTSEIVALAPLAIVPRLHVTVDVPLHDPWLGVAETNVVPVGIVSVTVTPVAGDGPALSTLIV